MLANILVPLSRLRYLLGYYPEGLRKAIEHDDVQSNKYDLVQVGLFPNRIHAVLKKPPIEAVSSSLMNEISQHLRPSQQAYECHAHQDEMMLADLHGLSLFQS